MGGWCGDHGALGGSGVNAFKSREGSRTVHPFNNDTRCAHRHFPLSNTAALSETRAHNVCVPHVHNIFFCLHIREDDDDGDGDAGDGDAGDVDALVR